MKKIILKNLDNTCKLALSIATKLNGGDVLALCGPLGSGKTTFVQCVARSLGVHEEVKSPTFILMQIFAISGKENIQQLCHVDAYRLHNANELFGIGFEEYAGEKGTVTLVEWADRVPELHRIPSYKEITFIFDEEDGRILQID